MVIKVRGDVVILVVRIGIFNFLVKFICVGFFVRFLGIVFI